MTTRRVTRSGQYDRIVEPRNTASATALGNLPCRYQALRPPLLETHTIVVHSPKSELSPVHPRSTTTDMRPSPTGHPNFIVHDWFHVHTSYSPKLPQGPKSVHRITPNIPQIWRRKGSAVSIVANDGVV